MGSTSKRPAISLNRPFIQLAFSNVVYAAGQWIIISQVSKRSGTESVGAISVALAFASPIVLMAGALRGAYVSDVEARYSSREYGLARMLLLVVGGTGVFALALASGYSTAALGIVLFVFFARLFESLSDGAYAHYQKTFRFSSLAFSRSAIGILQGLLSAIALYLYPSDFAAPVAMLIGSSMVYILYDFPRAPIYVVESRSRIRWTRVLGCLYTTAPLATTAVLHALAVGAPRYILERNSSLLEAGTFACLFTLIAPGQTVVTALGNAALPRLCEAEKERKSGGEPISEEGRLLRKTLLISVSYSILLLSVTPSVLAFLFNSTVAAHIHELRLLAGYSLLFLICNSFGYILTARRAFRIQWIATSGSFLTTVVLLLSDLRPNTLTACEAILAGITIQLGILGVGYTFHWSRHYKIRC